jgi:hypothetical protein
LIIDHAEKHRVCYGFYHSSCWIEPLFKARRVADPLVLGSMVDVIDIDSLVVVVVGGRRGRWHVPPVLKSS